MDAQNLTFHDNMFDVIVSRNLTWNLDSPAKAYREWYRVLKPGSILLNFDANWYAYLYDFMERINNAATPLFCVQARKLNLWNLKKHFIRNREKLKIEL